jgi:hypothetical protein
MCASVCDVSALLCTLFALLYVLCVCVCARGLCVRIHAPLCGLEWDACGFGERGICSVFWGVRLSFRVNPSRSFYRVSSFRSPDRLAYPHTNLPLTPTYALNNAPNRTESNRARSQIDPALLDQLIANLSSLSSVYHKPPEAFVKGGKAVVFTVDGDGEDDEDDEGARARVCVRGGQRCTGQSNCAPKQSSEHIFPNHSSCSNAYKPNYFGVQEYQATHLL